MIERSNCMDPEKSMNIDEKEVLSYARHLYLAFYFEKL